MDRMIYIPMPYKTCRKCGAMLPASLEFFRARKTRSGVYTLRSPCRACIAEKEYETMQIRHCIEPGCTAPRFRITDARCREHSLAKIHARKARRRLDNMETPE